MLERGRDFFGDHVLARCVEGNARVGAVQLEENRPEVALHAVAGAAPVQVHVDHDQLLVLGANQFEELLGALDLKQNLLLLLGRHFINYIKAH